MSWLSPQIQTAFGRNWQGQPWHHHHTLEAHYGYYPKGSQHGCIGFMLLCVQTHQTSSNMSTSARTLADCILTDLEANAGMGVQCANHFVFGCGSNNGISDSRNSSGSSRSGGSGGGGDSGDGNGGSGGGCGSDT
jgi:uncharacterized membrane protein YgcG